MGRPILVTGVERTLAAAADLLLGGSCLGCGKPGRSLCRECRDRLVPQVHLVTRPHLDIPVWAAGSYTGGLRHLLPGFKDAQALQLAGPLGRLLAAAIIAAEPGPDWFIVPVPSAPATVRRRGYPHVERLTRQAMRWLKPPLAITPVLQVRKHANQVGLTAPDRLANLAGTMVSRKGSGSVVLCDDVVTTGATLAEGVRALRGAGYRVRAAAVVAETRKNRDSGTG